MCFLNCGSLHFVQPECGSLCAASVRLSNLSCTLCCLQCSAMCSTVTIYAFCTRHRVAESRPGCSYRHVPTMSPISIHATTHFVAPYSIEMKDSECEQTCKSEHPVVPPGNTIFWKESWARNRGSGCSLFAPICCLLWMLFLCSRNSDSDSI